jgi:hypothetical protein
MIKLKLQNGWKKCELKEMWLNCSYYSIGQMKGLDKSTKSEKDSWSLDQDMNPGQPEYTPCNAMFNTLTHTFHISNSYRKK